LVEEIKKEKMKKKSLLLLYKTASYGSLLVGIIFSASIVILGIVLSATVPEINLTKMLLVDFILLIVAIIVFLLFLTLYEFFKLLPQKDEEIEQLEMEVEYLEENTVKNGGLQ
jgi:phosphotransferase system  glucose/maltose/N-acetylglucosamine-specific IIC component